MDDNGLGLGGVSKQLESVANLFASGAAWVDPAAAFASLATATVAAAALPPPPADPGAAPEPAALASARAQASRVLSLAVPGAAIASLFDAFAVRSPLSLLTDRELRAAAEGLARACAHPHALALAAPGAKGVHFRRGGAPKGCVRVCVEDALESLAGAVAARALNLAPPPPEWLQPPPAAGDRPPPVPAALADLAAAVAALRSVVSSGVGAAAGLTPTSVWAAAEALLLRGPRGGPWEPVPLPDTARAALLARAPADALEWLDRDAMAHFEATRLPPELDEGKRAALRALAEQAAAALGGARGREARLLVFGSTLNGLGQVGSDMDVVCVVEGFSSPGVFRKLEGALVTRPSRSACDVWVRRSSVPRALVPVITLQDASGLSVDLVVNSLMGLHNTGLLASYCALDPRVQPFAFAVKRWAKSKAINKSFDGFISSYAWAILCIFFLQRVGVLLSLQSAEARAAGGDAGGRVVAEAAVGGRHNVAFLDVSGLSQPLEAARGARAAIAALTKERQLRRLEALGGGGGGGAGAAPHGLPRAPHPDLGDALCAAEVELFDALYGREAWASGDLSVGQLLAGFFPYFILVAVPQGPAVSIRTGSFLRRTTYVEAPTQAPAAPDGDDGDGAGTEGGAAGSEGGGSGDEDEDPGFGAPYRLSIEDPFERDHDLGRCTKPLGAVVVRRELLAAAAALREAPPAATAALYAPSPRPPVSELQEMRREEARNKAAEPPRLSTKKRALHAAEAEDRARFQAAGNAAAAPGNQARKWWTARVLIAVGGGPPAPPNPPAGGGYGHGGRGGGGDGRGGRGGRGGGGGHGGGGGGGGGGGCYTCGKSGHKAMDCPTPGGARGRGRGK